MIKKYQGIVISKYTATYIMKNS